MGQFFDEIPEDLIPWIEEQKIFFVATANANQQGHVNVSAKGRPCFRLLDQNTVLYYDLTGSTNETFAHLQQKGNSRITLMFISFEGPPRVLRMFGHGKTYLRGSSEFEEALPLNEQSDYPGVRCCVKISVHKVGTSCGFAIPYYDYRGERLKLDQFMELREKAQVENPGTAKGIKHYWAYKNSKSIDGLPGLGQVIGELAEGEPLKAPFDVSQPAISTAVKTAREFLSTFPAGFLCACILFYLYRL